MVSLLMIPVYGKEGGQQLLGSFQKESTAILAAQASIETITTAIPPAEPLTALPSPIPKLIKPTVSKVAQKVLTPTPTNEVTQAIYGIAKELNFNQPENLVKLAYCESRLHTTSYNPSSGATGLFQITNIHGLSSEDRHDIGISTRWAINKIKAAGYRPWAASKKCHGL